MEKEKLNKKLLVAPIFKKLKIVSGKSLKSNQSSLHHKTLAPESLNKTLPTDNLTSSDTELILSETSNSELKTSTNLKGYSKIQELKLVKIQLASPQKILEWAEKILPNGKIFGEVLNANTLHYKTFKPHKGGLFCERIFGPLKDFECSCGIKQRQSNSESYVEKLLDGNTSKRIFCPVCDVEYTWSVIRRYQLGYIKLVSPVTHLWYLKTNPSYLSLLLDIRKKDLESIIYCMQITTLEYYWKPLHSLQMDGSPATLFNSYKNFLSLNQEKQKQSEFSLQTIRKLNKQKARKNLNIQRQSIYHPAQTTQDIESLNKKPLQTKIDHLEKSFQLSSSESYSNNLEKISRITNFLKEKINKSTEKNSFLKISNKTVNKFYRDQFNLLFYRLFIIQKQRKQLNSPNYLNLIINKVNNLTNFNLDDTLFNNLTNNLNPQTAMLIVVFEAYLKSKESIILDQNTEEAVFYSILDSSDIKNSVFNFTAKISESKILQSHGKHTEVKFMKIHPLKTKEQFRQHFLKLMKKVDLQTKWDSIYKEKKKSLEFLGNGKPELRLLKLKMELPNFSVKNFIKNSSFLHLLFLIQEKRLSFLKTESFNQGKTIRFILRNLLSKNDILRQINPVLQDALKKQLLQTPNQPFKICQNLQSNSNFDRFSNIILNYFIHRFLNLEINQPTRLKENSQKIVLSFNKANGTKMIMDPKEIKQFSKKNFEFLANEMKNNENKVVFQTLLEEKKIQIFLRNNEFSSLNYSLYIKNLINLSKSLLSIKHQNVNSNLFNKIYTLSYLKGWETEREWKYFLYYNTSQSELSDKLQLNYQNRFVSNPDLFTTIPIIGANLIQNVLFQYEGFELKKMAKQYQNVLPKFNRYIRYQKQRAQKKTDFIQVQRLLQKRDQLIRRLKLLRKLFRKNTNTSSMVLKAIPVLPPDLRPILKLQNQIAASDLNRFYQRIIYRNDRLKKFLKMNSVIMTSEPSFEIKYAQRLLQEAVDNLIQNGKGNVKPETNSRGQPLKSLSEILKGKQGRFRQYLLGKRVDYSGRSVIVVGPSLKIYQCGLPFEMAMELFLPFLIKRIFQYNLARTVVGAKTILKTQKKVTWDLLEEVMYNHPILLNRAPTLHRLGIQAFQPKLVEGRAILLHPLVCPAFNADFDGDQMAVHVPITVEARTEAWKLLLSRNHLISPATGEPMLLPSQDMVLGCYYLTTESFQHSTFHYGRPFISATRFYFSHMRQVLQMYLQQKIHLQTPIWLKWDGYIESGQKFDQPLEIRIEKNGNWLELRPKMQKLLNHNGSCLNVFIRTTAGRVIFNALVEHLIND